MYRIDVKEPRRSPLRLSRADDEDAFGWDVKKHMLAMMPHEKKKDVFGMDVKTLVHIFPLHSTATC
jgi:hypothetical protein